jgi:Icc-related predicted phosphoesterase
MAGTKTSNAEDKKTRILAVGDIHGDTGLVKRLAEKAEKEKADIIILAGDITFAEMSLKNLIGPFAKLKKDILIVPGNHESLSAIHFLSEMYKPYAKNLHGYSFAMGNLGIFGAGGADIGINMISESEIFGLLMKGHDEIRKAAKKIMVTHMHPRGSKAEMFGFKGSKAITKAVYEFQPDILITSHIHEASALEEDFGKTRVINVSRKEKIFEI